MLITFTDYGAVAKLVITSSRLTLRKHNRVVDAVLFNVQGISENRSGFFWVKSSLSGKTRDILRAYKIVQREAN
ncbi:TPA: hypothetical protein JTP90_004182 [Escherichia coli]|uniref:hypothetical protein n=1 Tax=Escherichia coli TaxID=562 RepID=UPI000EF7E140|nr:hypothetical protein [Escherichia coli]AYW30951.1 hypothetical protein CQP61_16650 [Escherichia coli]EHL4999447.1 hypothetical protein [Escherichia coli]EIY9045725.1 hypothetical protein [Escherichia coli]EJB8795060.1 hypothetical protein [Escherichia coli]EKG5177981.1 hypothetical protein [Escherichia coli]